MESYNQREPSLRLHRTPTVPSGLMMRPPVGRAPSPRPHHGQRLALASDFEADIPPQSDGCDDFSDLEDHRIEELKRERRGRIWFFKALGAVAIAATAVVLVGMTADPGVRTALSSWATFGIIQ